MNATATTTSADNNKNHAETNLTLAAAAAAPTPQPPSRGTMIDSCIAKFRELGINLVAIDFDQTIVDVHTYGRWPGTISELADHHVRSEFRLLLQACCEHDIQVAVVTFSGQIKLVQGVLESIVGIDYCDSHVVIRGRDRSWSYQGTGSQQGKQHYIASAAEELEHKKEQQLLLRRKAAATSSGGGEVATDIVRIQKSTTVLIDDDVNNIRCALDDGTRAVWLNPNKPHHVLKDLARLV